MSQYLTPRQFARTAAVGFVVLIAALAIIGNRRGEDVGVLAPLEREHAEALATEPVRCRTVTPDQAASLENCRRIWAENRRQFFRPIKTPPAPAGSNPAAATGSGAIQGRISPVEADHQHSEVR